MVESDMPISYREKRESRRESCSHREKRESRRERHERGKSDLRGEKEEEKERDL